MCIKTRLTIAVLATLMVLLSGCSVGQPEPDNLSDVEFESYMNRTKTYQIDIPSSWTLVEDADTNIQSHDKIHLSPPGFSDDTYPHLITVEVSNLPFDQSLEIWQLTNEILEEEDLEFDGFQAKYVKYENQPTGKTINLYILEYISGQSIHFILRDDDAQHKAILERIYKSFQSLR